MNLDPFGGFTYVPSLNFNGTDSFTYRAVDQPGASSGLATVTINIVPVNDPPAAISEIYSVMQDGTLTIALPGILANDFDVDNDASLNFPLVPQTLTAVQISAPQGGSLTLAPNGAFTYTPSPNFSGLTSFTYRASDGAALGNTATVAINVVWCQWCDWPIAWNDSYTVTEDVARTVSGFGVLANDAVDPEADPVLAISDSSPAHGSLTFSSSGRFTFMPTTNFNGTDSFTYHLFDGLAASNTATVTLNVLPINDPPVANGDGAFGATSGIPLLVNAPGVLLNDYDVDNLPFLLWQGLSVVLVSFPTHGTLTLAPNGAFTYVPSSDPCVESDSFTYRASDGQASSGLATVTINVLGSTAPPVAVNDNYTVSEDIPRTVSGSGVLLNDAPDLCETLSVELTSVPLHGFFTISPTGGFTYLPFPQFHGTDSFTYRATDGFAYLNIATVMLNILAVNDPPTFTKGPDLHVTDQSAPQVVPGWAKNLSPGPPDEAGQTVGFSIVGNTNPGIIEGDIVIDPAGKLGFTPQPNVEGTSTITVRLQDSGGTANGGIDFSEQQLVIIVDKPHRWHNGMPPLSPHDRGGLEVVFEDEAHSITPTDVLLVINYLNAGLPTAIDASAPLANGTTRPFYDVDGDDIVTSTDALLIIDVLNAGQGGPVGGEGEAASSAAANSPPKLAELISMMAFDAAELETRRRTGK